MRATTPPSLFPSISSNSASIVPKPPKRSSRMIWWMWFWLLFTACPAETGPCKQDSDCKTGGNVCQNGVCVCRTGETRCGTTCVDTTKSGSHCGACDKACKSGESCVQGLCKTATACDPPKLTCAGACIDPQTDAQHCGACGTACGEGKRCQQGRCELACAARLTACNDTCTDLQANGQHCGACGKSCDSGQFCAKGMCVAACPEATPTVCLGGCVDEQNNTQHCGACGKACAAGQACVKGLCQCAQGLTDCNGKCVDLRSNQQACGSCEKSCDSGQFCSNTGCVATCPAATPEVCLGGCVNFQTDALHCGACGQACAPDERCEGGVCVCGSGRLRCSGACVDSQTDLRHCGQCDLVCPRNQRCDEGICTDKCPAETLRCGEFCVDVKTSDKHCGACDKACSPVTFCQDSLCVPSNCPIGQRRCNGKCVDLLSDEAHCGQCQQACIRNQVCVSGQCTERPVVETFAGQPPWRDGEARYGRFAGPTALSIDANGNLYIADRPNHRIRKLDPLGNITTVAGSGKLGYTNGPSSKADLDEPSGVAVAPNGEVYFAERGNDLIRKIDTQGRVVDVAGTGRSGFADGPAKQAQFDSPYGIRLDASGNLYVADRDNHRIRKIDTQGNVSTLAGSRRGRVNGAGSQARFDTPRDIAVDKNGNVYVADYGNEQIRKITPTGEVSIFAGDGIRGYKDGPKAQAQFSRPTGVTLDANDNLYIVEEGTHRIRKIDAQGIVTTLAGTGLAGSQDGPAATASLNLPTTLIIDSKGEIWIADTGNRLIRTLDTQGQMRTSAGGKTEGSVDGPLNEALFNTPSGLAFDGKGNLFVADEDNHAIRKITPNGDVSTIAGTGVPGFLDGPGKTALFDSPHCVAVNSQGAVFVADSDNHRIRKIDAQGDVTTFAGQATPGLSDGMGGIAQFSAPYGLAFDKQDNLYVADSDNHVIRKIDPQGNVVTFAGTGSRGYQDGPSATARFDTPYGLAFDGAGHLYVADRENHRIRKIDPQGVVSTVAGTGNNGYSDGAALQAEFDRPISIVLDAQGNLFIVDQRNERIRQLDTTGKVTTLAGTGTAGFQDGPLNQAQFNEPFGITIDANGVLYIGDRENYSIRRILR